MEQSYSLHLIERNSVAWQSPAVFLAVLDAATFPTLLAPHMLYPLKVLAHRVGVVPACMNESSLYDA